MSHAVRFDEFLIAEVQNYSHLYDTTSKHYRDTAMADASWISIGETLNKPPKVCKDRWRYLRDQYAKKRKEYEGSPSEPGVKRHRWRHYDSLCYLSDFIKHRQNDMDMPRDLVLVASEVKQEIDDPHTSPDEGTSTSMLESEEVNAYQNRPKLMPPTKVKSKVKATDDVESAILRFIERSDPEPNAEMLFGRSVGATLMRLSSPICRLAKVRIQQVLFEMEELDSNGGPEVT